MNHWGHTFQYMYQPLSVHMHPGWGTSYIYVSAIKPIVVNVCFNITCYN